MIVRHQNGELTPEELKELEPWRDRAKENQEFLDKVSGEALLGEVDCWTSIDPVEGFAKTVGARGRQPGN